jgi:hypothetical protein
MTPLAATLTLLLASASSPTAAVEASLALAGAHAEVGQVRTTAGHDCAAAAWEALRPVASSGRAPLRFSGLTAAGHPCQGFAWASVALSAPAAATTRALKAGEPLDGAVIMGAHEVLPGRHALAEIPPGAAAARALPAGTVLDESSIRVGPESGAAVTVVLRLGALSVEQPGRAVPCRRGRACALLPSGRRVEGRFLYGRLLVEAP